MTITIVSGFGRCGSSLIMQMLEAGGMPVSGRWPAFEDPVAAVGGPLLRGDASAMEQFEGRAVKILDPQSGQLPPGDYRAIWCKRTYREQARSQAKMLRLMSSRIS